MQSAPDAGDLFLPEPEPREVRYTVISVDDHVVEPPHMFEGRLPAALADRAPRIVETPEGHQVWEFEGERYTQVGMNAVAGRRPETVRLEPFRFDQMRPGCYDIDARVRDMDINGVWASLNFPSQITGLLRPGVLRRQGPRARRWPASGPGTTGSSRSGTRAIPSGSSRSGSPSSPTPAAAAAEIRRNAARGFTSVTLPERPHRSACPRCGTASTGTRSSRPCVETDTVISPARRQLGPDAAAARAGTTPCSSGPRCSASCR